MVLMYYLLKVEYTASLLGVFSIGHGAAGLASQFVW